MQRGHGTRWAPLAMMPLLLALTAGSHSAGEQIAFVHDDSGRLREARYGNGTVIAYDWDANGNLLSRTVTLGGAGEAPFPVPPTVRLDKAGPDLVVTYATDPCPSTDHAVFVGNLGAFGAVTAAECTTGSGGTAMVARPSGDAWFLVAGVESTSYSGVGQATAGARTLNGVDAVCPEFTADASQTCP